MSYSTKLNEFALTVYHYILNLGQTSLVCTSSNYFQLFEFNFQCSKACISIWREHGGTSWIFAGINVVNDHFSIKFTDEN